jgi:hypothetical protein
MTMVANQVQVARTGRVREHTAENNLVILHITTIRIVKLLAGHEDVVVSCGYSVFVEYGIHIACDEYLK